MADLCDYFEGCGVAQELVLQIVRRLYDRRLIEALDPNVRQVGMTDKVAIKDCGVAHIELVLSSAVYVEQMGLTAGLNEISVRDELRRRVQAGSFIELRDIFLRYVLKVDAARISIPSTPAYAQLIEARRHIKGLAATERPPRRHSPRVDDPQRRAGKARSQQANGRR